jgi:galactokinase
MNDGHCLVYGTNCGLHARIGWSDATPASSISTAAEGDFLLRLHFRSVVLHPPQSQHFVKTIGANATARHDELHSVTYETQFDHSLVSILDVPLLTADGSVLSDVLERLAQGGSFFSYVAGSALEVLLKYSSEIATMARKRASQNSCSIRSAGVVFSIDNYDTDLPVGKGLSSSAAVCVLVVRSLAQGVLEVALTPSEEMELAYLGERRTPSQCGRMDQCVAHGAAPVSMLFGDDGSVRCEKIVLPDEAVFYFVVADMNRSKDTHRILGDLNACFKPPDDDDCPCSSTIVVPAGVAAAARKFLWSTSSTFVMAAMDALRQGSPETLGSVFNEYQVAFRTALGPACPTELTSPRLYELLSSEKVKGFVHGGKGVGSQGDGTIQFVCRSAPDQALLVHHLEHHEGCHAFAFELKGGTGV